MLGSLNEIFKFSAKKTIDQEANYIILTRKVSGLTMTLENPASYIVFTEWLITKNWKLNFNKRLVSHYRQ